MSSGKDSGRKWLPSRLTRWMALVSKSFCGERTRSGRCAWHLRFGERRGLSHGGLLEGDRRGRPQHAQLRDFRDQESSRSNLGGFPAQAEW
jgi:hypothetical protein